MNLWIAVGLITFAVSVYLLRPLIRGGNAGVRRGDFDLSVYRRQLDELAADAERGVISGPEAEAARVEIQRRMIQTGRDAETAAQDGGNSRFIVGAIVAIALPAAAAALYMVLGSPNLPSQPLADRGAIPGRTQVAQAGGAEAAASQEGLASIEKMVESLSDKLEKDPTDFDGWMLLGRSYGVMEAYDKAVEAYARAAALPEGFGDANAQMQLGETIIFASQGVVTERAQGAFRRALEIDPGHPGRSSIWRWPWGRRAICAAPTRAGWRWLPKALPTRPGCLRCARGWRKWPGIWRSACLIRCRPCLRHRRGHRPPRRGCCRAGFRARAICCSTVDAARRWPDRGHPRTGCRADACGG